MMELIVGFFILGVIVASLLPIASYMRTTESCLKKRQDMFSLVEEKMETLLVGTDMNDGISTELNGGTRYNLYWYFKKLKPKLIRIDVVLKWQDSKKQNQELKLSTLKLAR